jgi:N-acetylmuramoyl-L-alanine amidase
LVVVAAAILFVLVMIVRARATPSAAPGTPRAPTPVRPKSTAAVAVPAVAFAPGLSAGTCLMYPPLHGDTGHTVFIDPGHGGIDPGNVGQTSSGQSIDEKDLDLAVARAVLPLLRNSGYTVVLSRNSDVLVARAARGDISGNILTMAGLLHDTAARVACANAARAQILLAIHFNAASNPSLNGTETIYDTGRPFSAASKRLALLAQADVLAQLRGDGWLVPDRGVHDDNRATTPAPSAEAWVAGHLLELGPAARGWLAQPSTMPGALLEPFFLTHPAEADVASSSQGQQDIAVGLANAIKSYFTAAPVATVQPPHR